MPNIKTFVYQGNGFFLLVESHTKEQATEKIKQILNIRIVDVKSIYEGIFRATKL